MDRMAMEPDTTRPLRRSIRRAALVLTAAALVACSGPKLFVGIPGKDESPSTAPAPATAPDPVPVPVPVPVPAASPAASEAPAPGVPPAEPSDFAGSPYWVVYQNWRAEHRNLERKLESTLFSVPAMEKTFVGVEESLQELATRLSGERRAEADAFLARYVELRKAAVRDVNRQLLHRDVQRLGREIEAKLRPAR